MIGYKPAPHVMRMTPYSASRPPSLGQADTAAAIIPMAAAGLAGVAFVGATGWVGIRTGLREEGWLSAVGWITGIGGILLGGLFYSIPVGMILAAAKKPETVG